MEHKENAVIAEEKKATAGFKFWLQFANFVKKILLNKKIMLTALLAIVAVIIATIVFVLIQEKHRKAVKLLYVDAFYKYSEIQNDMTKINMERAGRAIAALEKVVNYNYKFPEYYLAHYELGNIYISLNKLDLAKKHYQALTNADKDLFIRGKALINLAKIYQHEEKYDEALKIYNDLVSTYQDYNRDVAYYFMGICYEKKGNIDKAISAYKMVNKESAYGQEAEKSIQIIEQLKRLN